MIQHTPGPWRDGDMGASIVADQPVDGGIRGSDDVSAYGGHLICESVSACNRPVIKAAPDMLAALQSLIASRALDEVRGTIAGWNGPEDKPYPPHPSNLGATIRTTCGRMYKLDAALKLIHAAIAKATEQET